MSSWSEAGAPRAGGELVLERRAGMVRGERDAALSCGPGPCPTVRSTPGSPSARVAWPPRGRRQVARLEGRDRPADLAGEHVASDAGDAIDREAELLEDRPGRRRRAEVVEADDRALVADPALPAERHAGLDG